VRHGRALGLAPNFAQASFEAAANAPKEGEGERTKPIEAAIPAFVLQQRAAEDRKHNKDVQQKARDKMTKPENMAFRPRIPPRAGQAKEYRKQDPKWLDTVMKVDTEAGEGGFQGGRVLARNKEGKSWLSKPLKSTLCPTEVKTPLLLMKPFTEM